MASADAIRAEIRRDLRDLETNRLQFDITRRRLLVAARQVEQAQINVRGAIAADSSTTQDLLGALRALLEARNSLINNWVSYETSRMRLYRDLDVMEIDSQGVWTNEHDTPGVRDRLEADDLDAGGDDADADQAAPPATAQ
jgi:outer membrane protein TolC